MTLYECETPVVANIVNKIAKGDIKKSWSINKTSTLFNHVLRRKMAMMDEIAAANKRYIGLTLKCRSSSKPKIRTGIPDKIIYPRYLVEKLSELYHAYTQPINMAIPPILGVDQHDFFEPRSRNPREEYRR